MAQGFAQGVTFPLTLAQGGTGNNLIADEGAIPYSGVTDLELLAATATAGLALLSGSNAAPTWSTAAPITQVVTQVFTASGTYTPTAGMAYCIVEVQAGGGGGGGTNSAGAGLHAAGAGGGGGGYAMSLFTAAAIGASQAVTIGAAGAAGTAGGGNGGTGGTSSLGTLIVCTGGAGGAGQPTVAGGAVANAGGPGIATTPGNLIGSLPGQHGRNAAGTSGNVWVMPSGGSSQLGQGGPGRVLAGGAFSTSGSLTYLNAQACGGGGAGGIAREGGGTSAGGVGTVGIITVIEYITE